MLRHPLHLEVGRSQWSFFALVCFAYVTITFPSCRYYLPVRYRQRCLVILSHHHAQIPPLSSHLSSAWTAGLNRSQSFYNASTAGGNTTTSAAAAPAQQPRTPRDKKPA